MTVLNEMYFGKPYQLITIEDLFDKFKASYSRSDPLKSGSTYREMLKDPILKKIGKYLSECFGFKETCLTIARDPSINAYTISFVSDNKGNSYDLMENPFTPKQLEGAVTITNAGFRFNQKKFATNLLVCLNLGILFRTEITTPELMGILLHEIGHNFSKVIIPAHKVSGRVNEKFADQFAAMYGYGADIASAFSKMTVIYGPIEKAFKNVPVVNILVGLSNIWDNALMRNSIQNEHPAMRSRMEAQIKQLEQDLKDTPELTPEMREDIKKQIERCKQIIAMTFDGTHDNMADRITYGYYGKYEPNFSSERNEENMAEKYSNPEVINKKIGEMYQKHGLFSVDKKINIGWTKKYRK